MDCGQKSFKLVWRCHQLLSGILANDHMLRVSRQSTNDKSDNEMIPGVVHRSSGIYFTAEENPGESQLGDSLMKAVRPVTTSNGIPYLQMRSVEIIVVSFRLFLKTLNNVLSYPAIFGF